MASEKSKNPKGVPAPGQPVTANECTLDYQGLLEHQYILRKTLLPIKGTGLLFHITHNLGVVDKELKAIEEAKKQMDESVVKKDSEGRIIKFKAESKQTFVEGEMRQYMEHVLDDKNEPIPLDFESTEPSSPFFERSTHDFQEAYKLMVEKKRDVTFEIIPKEKIKKLMDSNVIDGVDLTLIFGTIIV